MLCLSSPCPCSPRPGIMHAHIKLSMTGHVLFVVRHTDNTKSRYTTLSYRLRALHPYTACSMFLKVCLYVVNKELGDEHGCEQVRCPTTGNWRAHHVWHLIGQPRADLKHWSSQRGLTYLANATPHQALVVSMGNYTAFRLTVSSILTRFRLLTY